MPESPQVSVLMPVYNASAFVAAAVESILAQTFRDFEFVIIDDGSTDGSLAILKNFANVDARIRLISRRNTGYVVALNEGLELCRGEFLARMDADDKSLPQRFERQVNYLNAHPECVAAGTRMRVVDPSERELCEYFTATSHAEIDATHLAGRGAAIGHPSVMMRRDALTRVGGYRPEFCPAEDLDLWLRLAEIGELANLTETLVVYRLHEKSVSSTRQRQQLENAHRAITEACARRGLPKPQLPSTESKVTPTYVGWTILALSASNYSAARHWAWRALRESPTSSHRWKLFVHAMLGRHRGMFSRAKMQSEQL